MKIAIGSDHAGYKRKKELVSFIAEMGHRIVDLGCYSEDSCDYPDFAKKVAQAV